MARRGRTIVEAAGVYWHGVPGRMLMSLPYHLALAPDRDEIAALLRRTRAAGVRYPSTEHAGLPSGVYVCTDRAYDFPNVRPRQRTKTRGGLRDCEIRELESKELLTQGLQLNLDTMRRQGRWDPEFGEARPWMRLVEAVRRSPDIRAMGALVDGKLAAYNILYRAGGWTHLLHQMSRTDLLDFYPNHALSFAVTRAALREPDAIGMSYGLTSLVSGDGLHQYKLEFGFEVAARNAVIQLHPAIGPVLGNVATRSVVHGLRRLRPQDQRLEYVEAVVRGAGSGRSHATLRSIPEGAR
jgi:hypothetical protein